MTRIERRELKEEELIILPLRMTFLRFTKVIKSDIVDLHISA